MNHSSPLLIRGLSEEQLAQLTQLAKEQGLSREAYVRMKLLELLRTLAAK